MPVIATKVEQGDMPSSLLYLYTVDADMTFCSIGYAEENAAKMPELTAAIEAAGARPLLEVLAHSTMLEITTTISQDIDPARLVCPIVLTLPDPTAADPFTKMILTYTTTDTAPALLPLLASSSPPDLWRTRLDNNTLSSILVLLATIRRALGCLYPNGLPVLTTTENQQ